MYETYQKIAEEKKSVIIVRELPLPNIEIILKSDSGELSD
jgi:hypothetical protein